MTRQLSFDISSNLIPHYDQHTPATILGQLTSSTILSSSKLVECIGVEGGVEDSSEDMDSLARRLFFRGVM